MSRQSGHWVRMKYLSLVNWPNGLQCLLSDSITLTWGQIACISTCAVLTMKKSKCGSLSRQTDAHRHFVDEKLTSIRRVQYRCLVELRWLLYWAIMVWRKLTARMLDEKPASDKWQPTETYNAPSCSKQTHWQHPLLQLKYASILVTSLS